MRSPTKLGRRLQDKWGSGAYGEGRGARPHRGTDYIVIPGASVYAPINGIMVREAKPYVSSLYSGCVIRGENMEIKMFYFLPKPELIGTRVKEGDVIGVAQDIAAKYPGMTPHIHLEISSINPEIFTDIFS